MRQVLLLLLLFVVPLLAQSRNKSAIPDVTSVSVTAQTESALTLQWTKVSSSDSNPYSYVLKYNNTESEINGSDSDTVTYNVSGLLSGTEYFFTLYTVDSNSTRSSGYNFSNITVPADVESVKIIQAEFELSLQWNKVNNNNNYSYELRYNNKPVTPITDLSNATSVTYKVLNLTAGTKYSFTLHTVFVHLMSKGHHFDTVTVPSNVDGVSVVNRSDFAITLQWHIVPNRDNNSYNYTLKYSNASGEQNITFTSSDSSSLSYEVSDLIPAATYNFTLYTVFNGVSSNGYTFFNSTTLSDVTKVIVKQRSQRELTIQWNKLNNNNIYNYTLIQRDINVTFTGSELGEVIEHTVLSLSAGTVYDFTLFTVVNNKLSTGYTFKNITTLDCVSFGWKVTNSTIHAEVNGSTHVTAQNSTDNEVSDAVKTNHVNLTNLYPGASYTVSLWYELESVKLPQCSHNLTLDPYSVSRLRCEYYFGGYGLAVAWDAPYGVVEVVEVNVDGRSFNQSNNRQEIKGLQAARWYTVTATSMSGTRKSDRVLISCQTNPNGVIAGILVFFLLVILICSGIYIWHRRKRHTRRSRSPVESNVSNHKYKPIPLEKFPEHFQDMSRDENRGFSEEYEDLGPVGVEQSCCAALLPENKNKNRFSNVLSYDCSRVHLTVKDEGDTDYINANYMPGFGNSSRQYIAAQGPLPCTVNDFWRMVWEQGSQAIVMVTNCTEGGRTKCEQYWPLDYTPCLYENLLVTVTSENKEKCWTLREFTVKNKDTSETRTVRHFHFTAWPDHGVPSGTEELIQFRGLIRQHIESSTSAGPTVVHCSAGVGRTGTLISLDVLLQQMEKEKAVGITGFVRQMRLNRPLMVQTESQYVFLHQCIMDSLQPKDFPKPEEPLYENSDMIYVNSMALKEYENTSQS